MGNRNCMAFIKNKEKRMAFDYHLFIQMARFSIRDLKNIPPEFRLKRGLFLFLFFTIFPVVALINGLCFLLDDFFFPDAEDIGLSAPVFIVGNPRSGTTFLHRLLSQDDKHFFFFKTWEIIFPAIVQKLFWSIIGKMDDKLGNTLSKTIIEIESRLFEDFNKMHKIGLFSPEEDDKLTFHIFSCIDLIWFFPCDEMDRFNYFDESLSLKEQKRIMAFYKKCIGKQMVYKKHNGSLLSKGPALSSKIENLYKYFPGCRIIYLIRDPLEVIPSMSSLAKTIWGATYCVDKNNSFHEKIYKTLSHYYKYPLEHLSNKASQTYCIVRYDDLIGNPGNTVRNIYKHFGLHLTQEFDKQLRNESMKTNSYKSDHRYTLSDTGLDSRRIQNDLSDVIERFWPESKS